MHDLELNLGKRFESNNFRFSVEDIVVFEDKVLVCKRDDKLPIAPGFWNVPGGKVKYAEGIEEALIREVKEETNLNVKEPIYLGCHFINKEHKRLVYTYYCEFDNIDDFTIDYSEFQEYKWITFNDTYELDSLSRKLKDHIKHILEKNTEK
ncbi:MAG: NUDIX hydrolase [Clostridioides sp.]|nr:NUDIX hydrolase [Clostridioides sp.]